MSEERLSLLTDHESDHTISVRRQLLSSLTDRAYRRAFVRERVRSSTALQIRALRDQREMTQTQLGDAIGMAQTWVSKLENPDYGKMTVATLLRLAEAFDTDLEIKFRPFSRMLDTVPTSGSEYYAVASFEEELERGALDGKSESSAGLSLVPSQAKVLEISRWDGTQGGLSLPEIKRKQMLIATESAPGTGIAAALEHVGTAAAIGLR